LPKHTTKQPTVATRNGSDDASLIEPVERDLELDLHSTQWGSNLPEPWIASGRPRTIHRELEIFGGGKTRLLRDHIVRFPSAPIYGINRRQAYDVDITHKRPNLHTLRLLTRPPLANKPPRPIKRLFVLHNGLNEWENMRFFFRLADWILNEDERAGEEPSQSACLIAPLPGHLMHFPHAGPFAQLPLSRYLSDAGDLFRHFLRYMVETRWLLSIVNEVPPQPWLVGGEPLGQDQLQRDLLEDWRNMREVSVIARLDGDPRAKDPEERKSQADRLVGQEFTPADATATIKAIRHLLGRHRRGAPRTLPVHVIGYSLGGFLAQSVFFAWPNMVTSCATICSGGAIRALSPTAFAHAEEWQSVLHSLRAEIEGSMLAGKISRQEDGRIAGVEGDQFGYFHQIFNQVFLQEDQASYKQRLSEHGSRMLFVSGGEDPIVKTRDVLDASPEEGITMLSVARMTHFLGEEAQTAREREQRQFWLPEAGGLIARAAWRAEELKTAEAAEVDLLRQWASEPEPADVKKPKGRDLASPDFEGALDWVVAGVEPGAGWLFICRNGIPAAYLPPEHQLAHGTALHHHDVAVQSYILGLARRAEALCAIEHRTTLCLSRKLKDLFIGSGDLFDPHNDAMGKLVTGSEREHAWSEFVDTWNSRIRWFDAGRVNGRLKGGGRPDPELEKFGRTVANEFARRTGRWKGLPTKYLTVSRLPDVWIAIHQGAFSMDPRHSPTTAFNFVKWVSEIIIEQSQTNPRPGTQPKSDQLNLDLEAGSIRIVRVAGTELNPRYRGRFESKLEPALLLLAHCAASLLRSRPGPAPA
jgi:pimeloyl-ACP methyl ester carboxylesterase